MSAESTPPTPADELGHLLRRRREGLLPDDVGLAAGPRCRTPGLRREEVAWMAAISTTYYTLLEQGRAARPSRDVLDGLARALRLAPAERDYVHALVHGVAAAIGEPAAADGEALATGMAELLADLDPHPAYVTGRRWDVLGANRAARLLWTDWGALPSRDRNLLLWMFESPAAREVFVDWPGEAAAQLARFRAAAARRPADRGVAAVVERLRAGSAEAREWWSRHDVAPLASGSKRMRHPGLGELELRHVVLQVADDPEQKLVAFRPSAADAERIARLVGAVGA